jgi:Cu2+-containing amine oxidase
MRLRFACAWLGLWLCPLAASAADHPLEPLSAAELQSAYESVLARFRADPKLPDEPLRFTIAVLSEPPKKTVLGWEPGRSFPRRAELHVLHYPSNTSWVAEVDLKRKRVLKLTANAPGVQVAASSEEYGVATELVRAYAPWRKALAARGVDPDLAYIDVWAPGDEPLPEALHEADIVLWYTTGFTHIAKPEDFPVMSTESIGFRLAPRGFFKKNPALSVADQARP